nr:hypothetical protein [Tanacetum cinerariifolium]
NVGGNCRNQFGQYDGQVAQNQQGFNAWQNGGIQGAQNASVQSGGNQNGLVVVLGIANQSGIGNVVAARAEGTGIGNQARCYNCRGLGHIARNCTVWPRRRDAAYLQTQLLIAQKEEAGIQLQAEEFDFMAAAGDLDEIEEVNANCILMANYSRHPHLEDQYTDILEPIPEPQLVPQNDNHVTSVAPSMVHSEGTVETSSAPNEEIRAHQETVYRNLVDQVAQDLSDDTTPSVARKFLNEVKSSLVTLQRVVKQKMTLEVHNWSSSAHKEKLESKIVELEFQVVNYEREISHLKTTYKNLFDSIKSNQAHAKLHDLIFENAKLRARLFENTSESVKNTSGTSVTPYVDKPKLSAVTPHSKKLNASTQVDLLPNKQSSASIRTNPITNSQRHVIVKETISSNMATASSTRLVHTNRTRRPQSKGNTRNARVPSASKSSKVKKSVTVEDHRRTLLLSKNRKTMSSECNNVKLSIRNDKSKIVCDTCKQCLVNAKHDACLTPFMNVLNPRANKLCANVPLSANQKRHRTQVWKPKQVGSKERLASKRRLPRLSLKWSPSGRSFDQKGKLVASKGTNCPNDDKACTSNPQEPMRKRFLNSSVFLGKFSKFVCGASTQAVPSI